MNRFFLLNAIHVYLATARRFAVVFELTFAVDRGPCFLLSHLPRATLSAPKLTLKVDLNASLYLWPFHGDIWKTGLREAYDSFSECPTSYMSPPP